jgi:hypothetical protein
MRDKDWRSRKRGTQVERLALAGRCMQASQSGTRLASQAFERTFVYAST